MHPSMHMHTHTQPTHTHERDAPNELRCAFSDPGMMLFIDPSMCACPGRTKTTMSPFWWPVHTRLWSSRTTMPRMGLQGSPMEMSGASLVP